MPEFDEIVNIVPKMSTTRASKNKKRETKGKITEKKHS